jgi:hypothetical protein
VDEKPFTCQRGKRDSGDTEERSCDNQIASEFPERRAIAIGAVGPEPRNCCASQRSTKEIGGSGELARRSEHTERCGAGVSLHEQARDVLLKRNQQDGQSERGSLT